MDIEIKEKTADIEEKYLKELKKIQKHANDNWDDQEDRHIKEDGLLCDLLQELGYEKIVEQYYSTHKWYA